MKTVSVRITDSQTKRLREVVGVIPGSSINGLAQRAIEQWLEIEAPVYLAAYRDAREKLGPERQPVRLEVVAR